MSDADPSESTQEHWEALYTERDQTWSGNPNVALVDVVGPIVSETTGHAIDLGSGEGADAVWLAEHGWTVTGIEVSSTAIERSRKAAQGAGIAADQIRWLQHDLADWQPDEDADLVTACFLHSTLEFDRIDIVRRAMTAIRPGGHLFILSHGASPPWSQHKHDDEDLPNADEEAASLNLSSREWQIQIAENRPRTATGPEGEEATLDDVIVLARRRA